METCFCGEEMEPGRAVCETCEVFADEFCEPFVHSGCNGMDDSGCAEFAHMYRFEDEEYDR